MSAKTYQFRCPHHPETMLVDLVSPGPVCGTACPICEKAAGVELVCVDPVRLLHVKQPAKEQQSKGAA